MILIAALTTEATRADGVIGRWVVFGLLTILALIWITLIATVVRVHFGLGRKGEASPLDATGRDGAASRA